MVVALMIVLGVGGAVFKAAKFRVGGVRVGSSQPVVNSLMVEADAYDTADGGGAMIRGLAGPGTSLEAAGLVGGDIITSFDGQPVRDAEALKRLIAATPIGKAVEVIFIRDGGPPQKAGLTTTGREGFRGMDTLRQRPGGRGVLDVDFDDGDRVRVPGTNIYGVELDDVNRNGPADIAGLKEGDIVTTFGGKPIRTAGDLRYRAGAATPGDIVDVVVVRDGQQITIPVKMGRQK
jgi:S1-C subfamily serine protease